LEQEFREHSEPPTYHLVEIYEYSNRMQSDRIQLQNKRNEWKKLVEAEMKTEAEAAERREFERLKQKFESNCG
jgi:seryl-tRNA synthetase